MNRIQASLAQNKKLLSIYFTAGFPAIDDTVSILEQLQEAGVDMIELGLPFSDPLADGPTIQESSTKALHNGMTTDKLFDQLQGIRKTIDVPLLSWILQSYDAVWCRTFLQTLPRSWHRWANHSRSSC